MKQVVCLSTEPWSPTPGRTQHLINRLKDAQVLYFCPGGGLLDQRWRQPDVYKRQMWAMMRRAS